MRQRIVRVLAMGALISVSLAPLAVAGATPANTTAADTQAGSGSPAPTSPTPPPTSGTREAWDEALKSLPHADAGPVPSGATADAAPSAPAATATISVSPADNLVRGQLVSVTGSGFGTGGVVLIQCPAGVTPAYRCGYNTALFVTPDASGAITAGFTVHRFIRGLTGRVDCATAPDACDLVAADEGAAVLARHALAFDPTAPVAQPLIAVTPSTGLLAGQAVTVTGTGFLAGDFILIHECATIDPHCSGAAAFATVDNNGAFSTQLTVRLRVRDGSGAATHCLAVDCIVRAESNLDLEYLADAPILFDPTQPVPPPPAITVTPSTGLLHDQSVTISGTSFDAGGFVQISECASDAATGSYCGDYLTGLQVDTTGAFTTTASVSRLVTSFTTNVPTLVDCATEPCTVHAVGFSNDESLQLVANAPISFDDTVPPPPLPVVTVTPSTNLPYRAQVAVHGTGFGPNESVYAVFCVESAQAGGCGYTYADGSADASGTVDFTHNVKRRLYTGGVNPVDCIDVGTECSVTVNGQRQYERTQVAVTFDPNAPIPPPPAVTVTPDHDLGYRQGVSITGSGFTPGAVAVQQCGRVSGGGGSFDTCPRYTQLQADATGAISGTVDVRRILAAGPDFSIDCATSAQPCTLRIGFGDPDESAVMPLGFDPNSQPPPPPVLTITPSTHLRDGQDVTVSGTGFTAGALLGMAPCKSGVIQIADACDIGRASVVTTDANGAFSTTRMAIGMIGTADGLVDCTAAAHTCSFAVANAADLSEFAIAPMSFDTPALAVHSATVTEGTGAPTEAHVMVELSEPNLMPITVEWHAMPGTAGTDDYVQQHGHVVIPAGATEAMIHVEIVGDALDEPTERFTVEVMDAPGAHITDGIATVKIRDDDPAPSVSIADGRGREARGWARAEVLLSAPSGKTVIVHYVTHHGSARARSDYIRKDDQLVFLPGETRHVIRVALVDDRVAERTESFHIELDDVKNASVDDGTAIVTIRDDD